MELEKYTEIRGALRTPKYREVTGTTNKKHGDRTIEVEALTATNADGQVVDADEVSMDRFDRVLSLGVAQAMIASDTTNPVWDETTFPWVDANNNAISISIRQAVELQADGLQMLSAIWFKGGAA